MEPGAQLRERTAGLDRPARQHLVEDRAQGIDVGPGVDVPRGGEHLFRCHVRRRALPEPVKLPGSVARGRHPGRNP